MKWCYVPVLMLSGLAMGGRRKMVSKYERRRKKPIKSK